MVDRARTGLLVEILLDQEARLDERDDAAIDLSQSSERFAIDALLKVACDANQDDVLASTCGESIAAIAVRIGQFDRSWLEAVVPSARVEMIAWLQRTRPEWLLDDA